MDLDSQAQPHNGKSKKMPFLYTTIQSIAGAGITLGNVVCYKEEKGRVPPDTIKHERQHTYQSEKLGIFHFPTHLYERLMSLTVSKITGDTGSLNHCWHEYNDLEYGPSQTGHERP
jgi:hypothetical protein